MLQKIKKLKEESRPRHCTRDRDASRGGRTTRDWTIFMACAWDEQETKRVQDLMTPKDTLKIMAPLIHSY